MTRSAARRASAVQVDKSLPSGPSSEGEDSDSPASPPSASRVAWYWRLAMFLWVTSFAALLLYEWLLGIIKAW
ncbi:MAG TPA: hypothetical protein VMG10_27015 [Gemmataceae bacterium]|nr:hypothetical protein [Gemmataceae bacterium]